VETWPYPSHSWTLAISASWDSAFVAARPQRMHAQSSRAVTPRIADKLREADDVQHIDEILTVLMSEDAYKTADERAKALDAVIERIGSTVNPRYAKVIQGISANNLRGFAATQSEHRNNAPGLM
jgi:hypothetical protein